MLKNILAGTVSAMYETGGFLRNENAIFAPSFFMSECNPMKISPINVRLEEVIVC
jgi:hypothetical protein